ncbi:MAG: aspartate 1-decarboxylase [Firmicutes bacterium]|nr:aspartate 1-decarboxylase [Bacillota bacterium]
MQYRMMAGKIHRATVTEADLNYIGSITIDQDLLEASGLLPNEMVQITNLANGELWHTYIIPGPRGAGDICLNGPPARKFHPGDLVIIIGFRLYEERELAESYQPSVVFVDEKNRVTEVTHGESPFVAKVSSGLS